MTQKIEGGGGGGGVHPKSTYAREGVHRKSMHAYKGEGGGLIFNILVRTYYVNDPYGRDIVDFGHRPLCGTQYTDALNFGTGCRSDLKLGKLSCMDDISGLASSKFPISVRK